MKVRLTDDYYTGPEFRDMSTLAVRDWELDRIWEIDGEQLERWRRAEEAYRVMQEEIRDIMENCKPLSRIKPPFPGLPS